MEELITKAREEGRDIPNVIAELLLALEKRVAALEPPSAPAQPAQGDPQP